MPKIVYRTKMFNLEEDSLNIKGRKFIFHRIAGANTVGMIPIRKDGKIILERQYRYSIRKYLYELPAGHVEKGEGAETAAIREVEEETGYRPRKVRLLFHAYPSPGSKTELATYFVGTDLVKTKSNKEPDEIMTLKFVTYKQALEMVRKNQIRDLKTIAMLLFYRYSKK